MSESENKDDRVERRLREVRSALGMEDPKDYDEKLLELGGEELDEFIKEKTSNIVEKNRLQERAQHYLRIRAGSLRMQAGRRY